MDGIKFEKHCAGLLRRHGFYQVEITKGSHDQGIDIIARKHGKSYGIQCKYYQKPVGNHAVQQAYTGREIYGLDRAMVMTNSTFTKGAEEAAALTDVDLWDQIEVKKPWIKIAILVMLLVFTGLIVLYKQGIL